MPDTRVLGNRQQRVADQHERQASGRVAHVPLEELEQLRAPLVPVDPADVDREGPAYAVLLTKTGRLRILGHVGPDADHDTGHVLIARHALDHRALFVRVVHERAHAAKHRGKHREPDGGIALSGRHQDGAPRRRPRAVIRDPVAIAEEQTVVVRAGACRQVIDQRRTVRPFGVHPVELVPERVPVLEHPIGAAGEQMRITFVLDAKPPDGYAVDGLDAGGERVPPRDVVGGARRQHLDLCVFGEMFGDVTRVQLRAAVDRLAVALNDDGQFHCSSTSGGLSPPSDRGSLGCASAAIACPTDSAVFPRAPVGSA